MYITHTYIFDLDYINFFFLMQELVTDLNCGSMIINMILYVKKRDVFFMYYYFRPLYVEHVDFLIDFEALSYSTPFVPPK